MSERNRNANPAGQAPAASNTPAEVDDPKMAAAIAAAEEAEAKRKADAEAEAEKLRADEAANVTAALAENERLKVQVKELSEQLAAAEDELSALRTEATPVVENKSGLKTRTAKGTVRE